MQWELQRELGCFTLHDFVVVRRGAKEQLWLMGVRLWLPVDQDPACDSVLLLPSPRTKRKH